MKKVFLIILSGLVLSLSLFTQAATYGGGGGTADNPYQIRTAEQMNAIGVDLNDWASHFKLMVDIDMSAYTGTQYHIIGNSTTKFTGTFDGDGHVIRNLTITASLQDYVGLFGYVGSGGKIQNLGIENVHVTGAYNVGGLAGWNDGGMLSACSMTGSVSGTGHIGGLTGRNKSGSLTACYAAGSISGTNVIGGLAGGNYSGSLENCYATGSVSGTGNYVGGLTGYNNKGTLTACYAAGSVAEIGTHVGGLAGWNSTDLVVTACFWDTQISGKSQGVGSGSSGGITGKTTVQMQMLLTFANADWDFTNETANGTSDFWRMCTEGVDYPRLNWQSGTGDFACPGGVASEDLNAYAVWWLMDNCTPANNDCGGADLNYDGIVDLADWSTIAAQWLTEGDVESDHMVWVPIYDPGVPTHDPFNGAMSEYETTNAQYCQFLNAAQSSGDIIVDGSYVKGASGSNLGADYINENYYQLDGPGDTFDGVANGGKSRILYSGGSFSVEVGFENHPVTYVSWYGATAFCSYYGWRLPTEWDWQAVADYDGGYSYGCGVTIDNSKSNYNDSHHPHGTTPVGEFGAYGYGMADMAGNVWEWTSTVSGKYRVLRGGSWYYSDYSCTLSARLGLYPYNMYSDSGFRVCR